MKLGKTKALREYLDRVYPSCAGRRPAVIRMVTFRQTFFETQQTFGDFELYSSLRGDLDHVRYPRLIVQVESLHRLQMGAAPEPIDLLILDEAESVLAQFNSGLHRQFNAAFAMFQWMLATAARVVCLDANLGDRTLHVLQRMRPHAPVTFHWNRFPRAAGDRFFFTADLTVWLDRLFEALRGGQRVILPTNSLASAKVFKASIGRRFPDKTVFLYCSQTPPSEKARHFSDVHTHWSGLDALIYTPTVSAGISYEREHYDLLFGYFVDTSCNVETCRQMLGRVRNIRTKEHFVCLAGWPKNLPTKVDDICRLLYDRRTQLYRQIHEEGGELALQFEYCPNGEICFHKTPYFALWLETVRIDHLSKNSFAARFVDQVADTGASVEFLEPPTGARERLVAVKTDRALLKREMATEECRAIAEAPDLSPEEVNAVRERLSRQADVSDAERLGLAKYRLRSAFRWHGRPLDAAFVASYNRPEVTRVYLNLSRITAKTSLVESLRFIQMQEAADLQILIAREFSAFPASAGNRPPFLLPGPL